MRRTTRLTERDLTRIVKRVINEQPTTDCFKDSGLSTPNACKSLKSLKPLNPTIGTGIKLNEGCLEAIKDMMTFDNLAKVSKVLTCITKKVTDPRMY